MKKQLFTLAVVSMLAADIMAEGSSLTAGSNLSAASTDSALARTLEASNVSLTVSSGFLKSVGLDSGSQATNLQNEGSRGSTRSVILSVTPKVESAEDSVVLKINQSGEWIQLKASDVSAAASNVSDASKGMSNEGYGLVKSTVLKAIDAGSAFFVAVSNLGEVSLVVVDELTYGSEEVSNSENSTNVMSGVKTIVLSPSVGVSTFGTVMSIEYNAKQKVRK